MSEICRDHFHSPFVPHSFHPLTIELRLEAPEALDAVCIHIGEQHATGLRADHLLVHLAAEASDKR